MLHAKSINSAEIPPAGPSATASDTRPQRTVPLRPGFIAAERRKKIKKKGGKIVLPTMVGLCFDKVKHIA